MNLVLRFTAYQLAVRGRALELPQAVFAIAAREEQQETQQAKERRRHAGVVAIHAEAKLCIVHGRVEG